MLWIVDGGMINLPVVARVEDFKEDSYIEITGATENHKWKSEPTRYEKVVRCKDCMHNGSIDTDCPFGWKDKKFNMPSPNDFCSYGERKGQEHE